VSYPNQYLAPKREVVGVTTAFCRREDAEAHAAWLLHAWPGLRELRVEERTVGSRREYERLAYGIRSRRRPLPPPELGREEGRMPSSGHAGKGSAEA
jgi:hypothetical protein